MQKKQEYQDVCRTVLDTLVWRPLVDKNVLEAWWIIFSRSAISFSASSFLRTLAMVSWYWRLYVSFWYSSLMAAQSSFKSESRARIEVLSSSRRSAGALLKEGIADSDVLLLQSLYASLVSFAFDTACLGASWRVYVCDMHLPAAVCACGCCVALASSF